MRALFPLLLTISAASASAQAYDVHYQGNLTPLNITPTFDHGYLAVYDWDHRVDVFAADGALLYSAAAKVPGAAWAGVQNCAIDSDGAMAMAVRPASEAGIPQGGGIALFDRTGAQIRYLNTGGYLPSQVAFGPDHSIWTIGWLGDSSASQTADYSTLRNFAQDGSELGAFLPRASFPYGKYPIGGDPLILPMLGLWELRVANQRVEVILHRAHLWVETDLSGQEKGRWDTQPDGRPRAITQDGRAWRLAAHRLQVFDRSAGVWRSVTFDAVDGNLLGAEGNNLVFLLSGRNTVHWAPVP